MTTIRPVILSGGSGTRLWPLSTQSEPKQFVSLLDDGSLFARTLQRLDGRPDVSSPIIVTGLGHVEAVKRAATDAGVPLHAVLAEPIGRNTAPAAIAAALVSDPDDVLVILPSDHLIGDTEGFVDAVVRSVAHAASGKIVTFGIRPSRAETGYGYIEMGEPSGDAFEVSRFKEKPDREEAERLSSDGRHVWNSGMFIVSAGKVLTEAGRFCPGILSGVSAAMSEPEGGVTVLGEEFEGVEKISFDHAVMERTESAVVMPIDVGWDDVGSFEALWSVSSKDQDGNSVSGDVVLVDVSDSLIKSTSRTVAVAGLSDLVVVETPDAILVAPKSRSQIVREVVDRLGEG